MGNTLVAGGEPSGASQIRPAWLMTRRGGGLVIERPVGQGVVSFLKGAQILARIYAKRALDAPHFSSNDGVFSPSACGVR